ncbi:MAG TPA: hypothetical protein VHY08_12545, partial [Bacillota bacterium]|nr:hypothetical protein [Bacillota bacterium]
MAQRITVTKLQKNPLQAAIAWVDARLPVIYAMIPPVLLLAIIQYCPLNFYWILGFEGLRLYLFWPVICLILAWYPVYTGRIFFQRYGRSFYFPWFTSIGVSCMIILFLRLAAIWCLEWSIFGIIIASIFLAIGILGLIVGYTIYFELWRRWWFNGKIVDSVQESVLSTKINALDGGEKERPRSWWGSLHRREILDANYRLRQAMILKAFDQTPRVNDSDLYDFFRAGIAQVDYLKENFAVEYHNEKYDHQRQSPVEILMQIIAVGLRQLQQGTVYSHGGPMNYRTQLQNWAEYTASFLGVDGSAFKSLLQRYINIAYDHHVTEALQFRGQISDICNEFTSLSSPPAMPRLQEVCAELWLVVAPETLEPEVTLDIWREMRESMQLGLAIQISDGASVDAVTVFAIRRLVDLISRLRDSLPQGQQACLGSQLVVIREAEEQVNERIDGVIEELSEDQQPGILKKSTGDQIPSWPYHEVWHTPAVRRMVCCLTLLLWVVNMGFILFCNPQTSPFHFNTVEHVKDPRKYYKPADKFDLMAHNDNWIAYGTNNHGLELINIHSRLTRERVTMSPTLDLTNGLLTGSFMALSKDQGIRQITPYTGLPLINIFPWLPPPHKWVSALPPEPIKILANELTDEGWLLAMEGAGIARYQFKSDSTGNLVRTRSWQTGSQSNANLSQVSFTQTGIWSANREGEIHFTNKKTLKEVKSRFIETPPIINLTANYDGQWACATDNKDSLWFFPPGTKHWLGPFFGEPGSNEPYLNSINDVQKARVSGNLVWLGANNGLFCYDQQQRRLYCPDPNIDNGWMEPAPLKDSASAEQKVLVAGKQGVFSVKRQDGIFKVNPLDENAVRALGISSNGNLCVYAVKNQEVRFLKDPYGDKKPTTLIPDEGWRRLDGTPRILDVRKSENGLLFITSAGAFFYKEDNHTYLDGSKSRIPAVNQFPEQVITLNTFSDLNDTDGKVVAIANNQPHLLNSSAAPGQPVWTGLDPTHVSRPVKIAQAAGIIFGLGDDGRIYRYIDPVPDAYPVKSNQNPLEAGSQPPNQVCGDLAVQNNDNWRMVFHYQGNLVSYNSSTGRISGEPLPKVCQGGNDIRQIRLANGNPVYLLQNGKVYNQEGDTLFAAAGAPFPITSITSLNSDPGKDSLLIGGPNGLVMRYRWSNGMWESLG